MTGSKKMLCGVPQGSILVPLPFVLFVSGLDEVIKKHDLLSHFYADDIQLYLSHDPSESQEAAKTLTECVSDVKKWLSANRLKLNADKAEYIILDYRRHTVKVDTQTLHLAGADIARTNAVRDLGVIIDENLTMVDHVSQVVSGSFYQLRQLRTMVDSLTMEAVMTIAHAFISTRLDYCNSLFAHITDKQLSRPQAVQNTAARIITGSTRRQHIIPVLNELHWLPVKKRVTFKIISIVENA